MHIKTNSSPIKITVFILNGFSLIFKTISFFYLKIKSLKQISYKEVFIISVDNLSFGGTGKTPLIIQIGKQLQEKNIKFAVVTRGYLSKYEKKGIEATRDSTATDIGDEAALLKQIFKNQDILVGKNRHDSIKKAIKHQNKIILLDDGFQSTDIFKDIKIMLVNPYHHYYYLRNFKFMARKDDIVLTYDPGWEGPFPESENKQNPSSSNKSPLKNKILSGVYNFELGKFYNSEGKEIQVGNSPILGFSAVGDNFRFKKDLSNFNLIHFKGYRDHFEFTEKELLKIDTFGKQKKAEYLVCTEKDFIRIFPDLRKGIALIYLKNHIKYNINLIHIILTHAKKTGFI